MEIIPLLFLNLVLTNAKESEHLAVFVFFLWSFVNNINIFNNALYARKQIQSTCTAKFKKSFLFSYLLPFANTYFGRSIVNVANNVMPLYDVGYGGSSEKQTNKSEVSWYNSLVWGLK